MKKQIIAMAVLAVTAGAAMAQANDTLAKVKASGSITMGVRESSGALSFTLGDGKFAGFHVEVCQRVIAEVEKAAGRKLEVKYVPVTSQNRIPLVQNGTVDIECGSITHTAARPEHKVWTLIGLNRIEITEDAASVETRLAALRSEPGAVRRIDLLPTKPLPNGD